MTATISQRPTVDPQTGDIQLHGRQGFSLPVNFVGANGDPRDMTGLSIYFEVEGKLRLALAAGATVDERVITLSREDVGTLFEGAFDFAIVDESGALPDTPWKGRISAYGFKDQPA
jgi:hypothetical protein